MLRSESLAWRDLYENICYAHFAEPAIAASTIWTLLIEFSLTFFSGHGASAFERCVSLGFRLHPGQRPVNNKRTLNPGDNAQDICY